MPVETELYELLGVSFDATEDDIKKAYRKKAREHHPDKNINDPEAGQKFQEMAAAYEILIDGNKRAAYDAGGMDGVTGRGGVPGMDPSDMFAHMFTHFGFDFGPEMRGGGRRGGEDSIIPHSVTLEDLYNGKSIKMNMEKEVLCSVCKGSGARGNAKPKPCATCSGNGWTYAQSRVSPGTFHRTKVQCTDCKGHGEKLKDKDRCKKCKGEKTIKEKTRQEIFVEKGMKDRQRIPGVPAGDVIFVLHALPHDSFERSGDDLLAHVTITLSEALLGFSRIILKHLDGRGVKLASPPGKIIKPQDSIILRGEGMPIHRRPTDKGDLYVIFDIEMPDQNWLKTVDVKALEALLPAKRPDMDPLPETVDEADFEESDVVDFGEGEDDWEDDDSDDEYHHHMHDDYDDEPDCRPQ
ncbi:hypothetical protein D9613_007885 [Agrocybe pediades]|uniref:DnaJ-domain-containing protein n=1 Tax=Agrocybe pediades TaxID=84607 RepID=A0A8H4QN13_9AGAR|nr:hypothetical protein D9613_007885 [Agrocybe pediades]